MSALNLNLKRQLLLVSLLTLLVPMAGVKFAIELDDILRQQAHRQLQQQANRLATVAGDGLLTLPPLGADARVIYAPLQTGTLLIDGYADDWPGYDSATPFPPTARQPLSEQQPWQHALPGSTPQNPALYWQASHNGETLFLLVRVYGQQPQLFNPGAPHQSHHRLLLQEQNNRSGLRSQQHNRAWLLQPSAPGNLPARTGADWASIDSEVSAFWQPVSGGWQVEMALPRPAAGSQLAIALEAGSGAAASATTLVQLPAATLVSRNPELERVMESWLEAGQQVRVMEQSGWTLAHQRYAKPHNVVEAADTPEEPASMRTSWLQQVWQNLLQALVKANQPAAQSVNEHNWRQQVSESPPQALESPRPSLPQALARHRDGSLWLSAQAPVFGGRTLVLEQSLNHLLNISGAALGSVLARSLLIILGLVVVLLGYASWLSWRIRRLATWVNQCVDADGRIIDSGVLPSRSGSGSENDELGQLQQRFNQLISRLHGYNQYLESFSRRLSHELQTPLAVVRSSLDNLAQCDDDTERRQYMTRAQSAVARLSGILRSMSEASRLEHSLQADDTEVFDFAAVLAQVTAAYQALDPHHRIEYQGPPHGSRVMGSPELLVQLLDKLVDNARDFTPEGQRIELDLERVSLGWQLSVFNQGSQLPATADIFSAFVSHRQGSQADSNKHHLGQGLLIAQLIANHHQAHLEAENCNHNGINGVVFRLTLPAIAEPVAPGIV